MSTNMVLGAIVATSVLALAVWGYLEGRSERALEAEREQPVKAPSRVSQQNGVSVVTLSASAQQASGLVVTPKVLVSYRPSHAALAAVLAPEELIGLRLALTAAEAQAERTAAAAQASRAEYERSVALHRDVRDVSDKDFQAAEAAWRADEAALRAAQQTSSAAQETARQQWGPVLSAAALQNSAVFVGLSTGAQALLQITLPAGLHVPEAPPQAIVRLPSGETRAATFLSTAPRSDPRLQGQSFYYRLDEKVLAGQTLSVWLPWGAETQGALIPSSAVVSWQGIDWIYVQPSPERFERRELSTDDPTEGGWFVPAAFADGAAIVTTGAQLLLSEEQRAQIAVGEDAE